jgi:hypothetical protein
MSSKPKDNLIVSRRRAVILTNLKLIQREQKKMKDKIDTEEAARIKKEANKMKRDQKETSKRAPLALTSITSINLITSVDNSDEFIESDNATEDVTNPMEIVITSNKPEQIPKVSKKRKRNIADDHSNAIIDPVIIKYCYCHRIYDSADGDMVECCNMNKCIGGNWFHLKCANLKVNRIPNDWQCLACKFKKD